MAVQQVAPVACPNCGARFNTPVQTLIDGQDLALKSAFLQGRLNVARCPQCGFTSHLTLPMLYHDSEKELAFAFVPNGLQMNTVEQEKIIGNLTNSLMTDVPMEQRKFYMFNPKIFLTLESVVKAVLEAEGITEEVLQAQEARVKLIEEFMQVENEKTLKEKVKAHDAEMDKEFFEVLTASIQGAQMEGNMEGAQTLLALRTLLVRWSTQGRKIVEEIDSRLGLVFLQNQQDLLDRLLAARNDQEFEALIAAGHPLLDYSFFQLLTNQIDEVEKKKDMAGAKRLKEFRTRVLDVKAKMEEMSQAALRKGSELLKEILQSNKPDQVIEQKLDEIDEAFFAVLSANIEEARRQKQGQVAQAMELLGNLAMAKLQSRFMPKPEEPAGEEEAPKTSQILISSR